MWRSNAFRCMTPTHRWTTRWTSDSQDFLALKGLRTPRWLVETRPQAPRKECRIDRNRGFTRRGDSPQRPVTGCWDPGPMDRQETSLHSRQTRGPLPLILEEAHTHLAAKCSCGQVQLRPSELQRVRGV